MKPLHKLGKTSLIVFNTLHPDLQAVIRKGIAECMVDFGLHEGYRPPEVQFSYFKKGREYKNGEWIVVNQKQVITNVDGYKIKGNHNYNPSRAVDLHVYVPGKPQLKWDSTHLAYIAGCLMTIAGQLYDEEIIKHKIRWGCNWDMDGDLSDNKLVDQPHFEIYR